MHQSRCCNLLPFSCDVYWVALNLDVEYTEYIYRKEAQKGDD